MQQLQHIHVEEKPVPNFIVQQVKQVLVPDRPSLPQMSSSTYLSSNALAQHSDCIQLVAPHGSLSHPLRLPPCLHLFSFGDLALNPQPHPSFCRDFMQVQSPSLMLSLSLSLSLHLCMCVRRRGQKSCKDEIKKGRRCRVGFGSIQNRYRGVCTLTMSILVCV